jgi:hypothetical protein
MKKCGWQSDGGGEWRTVMKSTEQMQPAANFIAKRLAPYLATGLEQDDIAPVIAEALSDLTRITDAVRSARPSADAMVEARKK